MQMQDDNDIPDSNATKDGNETVPQPDCEGQVVQVAAEVHAPPINSIQNEKKLYWNFHFKMKMVISKL